MSGDFGKQQFQQQQFKHKPSDIAKSVDHDAVRESLKLPAKGLLITGLLSMLIVVFGTVGGLVYGGAQKDKFVNNLVWQIYGVNEVEEKLDRNNQRDPKAAQKASERRAAQATTVMTLSIGAAIIGAAVLCAFYCFAISGGVLMGQLRNYNLCRLACIVALIPVISPLIVVGIPFGIIGLAKLNKPGVKRAFS